MVRKDTSDERDYQPPTESTSRQRSRTWAEHQTSSLRKALLTNKKKRAEKAGVNKDGINVPYYEEFCRHVEDVRGYLHGTWEEQDEEEEEDGEGLLDNPLFDFQWTETEKDAFFHALSTHSRLRPDLIAANVKTKNVFQVCVYLKALEQTLEEFTARAAAEDAEAELGAGDDEDDHGQSGSDDDDEDGMPQSVSGAEQEPENEEEHVRAGQKRKRASSSSSHDTTSLKAITLENDPLERRKTYPIAHEMSTDWVDFEDRIAKVVSRFEEQCGGYVGSMSEARGRKKRKADNEEADGSEDDEEEEDEDPDGDEEEHEEEDENQEGEEEARLQTSGLYFLNNQLQALDNILGESEDATASLEVIPSPSQSPRPPPSSKPRSTSNSKSSSISIEGGTSVDEDELLDEDDIDSYIRPLPGSQPASRPQTPSSPSKSKGKETTPAPSPITDMSQLSPASRRRLTKRLYMRKQRALKKGLTEEEVDMKSVRLKSGPKAKNKGKGKEKEKMDEEGSSSKKKAKRVKEEDESEDEDDDDAEVDELDDDDDDNDKEEKEEKGSKPPTGRTTEYFKYKQQFLEAGIDADVINAEGLGYFNLGAIGRLMNFFSSGYGDRTVTDPPALSADLIRLLLDILCEFTMDVVHRSLLICESGNKARERSKVWRQRSTRQKSDAATDNSNSETFSEYVRAGDVKLALETMGLKFEERKVYFGRIMGLDVTEEESASNISLEARGGNGRPALTPHRALYPPFVHLPEEYGPLDEGTSSFASSSSFSASSTVPLQERRRDDDDDDSDEEEEQEEGQEEEREEEQEEQEGEREGEGQEEGQEVEQENDAPEPDRDSDIEMSEDTDDDSSLLPFRATASEDEEFQRQLLEEDDLDELDMMQTKDYEKDVWDRTLVPA